MGEIAELMLEGFLCSVCGEALDDPKGWPSQCPGCGPVDPDSEDPRNYPDWLSRDELADFAAYLMNRGGRWYTPKNEYEALRIRGKSGRWVIVYQKKSGRLRVLAKDRDLLDAFNARRKA